MTAATIIFIAVVVVCVAVVLSVVLRRRVVDDGVTSFRRHIDALSPEARREVIDRVRHSRDRCSGERRRRCRDLQGVLLPGPSRSHSDPARSQRFVSLPKIDGPDEAEALRSRFPSALFGKGDRIVLVALGTWLGEIEHAIVLIALGTHVIAAYRCYHLYRWGRGNAPSQA